MQELQKIGTRQSTRKTCATSKTRIRAHSGQGRPKCEFERVLLVAQVLRVRCLVPYKLYLQILYLGQKLA